MTIDEGALRERAEQAGLLPDGTEIGAGDLRRLCCDAEILPVVLGSGSEVVDLGRTVRLVTPELRSALVARDGGCSFPGCGVPEERCEAHHLVPWWAGGATNLDNLVLLCPHHHALVEPSRFFPGRGDPPDRWQIRLAADGIPEVVPPRRVDPERRPIRNQPRKPRAT